MRREYNYFKKSKEAKIRKSDPLFNELKEKLTNTSPEVSGTTEFGDNVQNEGRNYTM